MLGELLESRARRQRRAGGAMLSVTAHVILIGAATVATVQGTTAPREKPKPQFVVFTPAPPPKPATPRPVTSVRDQIARPSIPTVPDLVIVPPTSVPPSLPPIDPGADPTPDVFTVGKSGHAGDGRPAGSMFAEDPAEASNWRGNEVMMHVVSSAKPRYPETLRQSGIDGTVLVQFAVDTLGRVDMRTVRVIHSTHELFTQAVRSALAAFRFKPAEVGGKRVAALAEMPFEFRVTR